jgi:hypothetical protein
MTRLLATWLEAWLERQGLFVLHRIDGRGIGDVLCMSALMRAADPAVASRFIVISKYPEVFDHNPRVWRNIRFNRLGPLRKPLIKWFVRNVKNRRIGCFNYRGGASVPMEQWAADHRRRISLTQLFSEHMGLCRDYADLRSELVLTEEEIATFGKQLALPARYMVIKPTGPTGWTPNKEWGSERFQEVVYQLPEITWVQTGERSDPLLQGTLDLRGRTDLRQLFYVISRADGVLSVEGVYNHIASAFSTSSFVVFSGLAHPELALYANTVAIVRTPQVECAPCWLTRPCPIRGKPCTSDITPQQVVAVIRRDLSPAAPMVCR